MIQKGDCFTTEITDMGASGEGVGRADGMAFFISGAVLGDVATARAEKIKKTYGFARMENLVLPSAFRVQPPCPYFGRCGGCRLQNLSYPAQLLIKQKNVRENLIRLGGLDAPDMDACLMPPVGAGSAGAFRYRNKITAAFGKSEAGKSGIGFYEEKTHHPVLAKECLLAPPEMKEIFSSVSEWMRRYAVLPYDEHSGEGCLKKIMVRRGFYTKQIMVCLFVRGRLPHAGELTEILSAEENVKSICCIREDRGEDGSRRMRMQLLFGQPYITDELHLSQEIPPEAKEDASGGAAWRPNGQWARFRISPQSFYQINSAMTEKLYGTVLSFIDPQPTECIWDLYCGIGTISLFLAERAGRVVGVEAVPAAVSDAAENAAANGIKNVSFLCGKVEEVLPNACEQADRKSGSPSAEGAAEQPAAAHQKENHLAGGKTLPRPDAVVLDPPRGGCERGCLMALLTARPSRIVYVSCDSATLSRDMKILCGGGYAPARARVFDLFAQTMHEETVVLLQRT